MTKFVNLAISKADKPQPMSMKFYAITKYTKKKFLYKNHILQKIRIFVYVEYKSKLYPDIINRNICFHSCIILYINILLT